MQVPSRTSMSLVAGSHFYNHFYIGYKLVRLFKACEVEEGEGTIRQIDAGNRNRWQELHCVEL